MYILFAEAPKSCKGIKRLIREISPLGGAAQKPSALSEIVILMRSAGEDAVILAIRPGGNYRHKLCLDKLTQASLS